MTWQRFNRDPVTNGMSDKNAFTFWTWFFRLMELVKNKMVNKYWNEGYVQVQQKYINLVIYKQLITFFFQAHPWLHYEREYP